MIERDDVDAALRDAIEPIGAARGMNDLEAEPRQPALDQPGHRLVIVDIQQCGRRVVHGTAAGT